MARDQRSLARDETGRPGPVSSRVGSSAPSPLATDAPRSHPEDGLHLLMKALARELARADHARDG